MRAEKYKNHNLLYLAIFICVFAAIFFILHGVLDGLYSMQHIEKSSEKIVCFREITGRYFLPWLTATLLYFILFIITGRKSFYFKNAYWICAIPWAMSHLFFVLAFTRPSDFNIEDWYQFIEESWMLRWFWILISGWAVLIFFRFFDLEKMEEILSRFLNGKQKKRM